MAIARAQRAASKAFDKWEKAPLSRKAELLAAYLHLDNEARCLIRAGTVYMPPEDGMPEHPMDPWSISTTGTDDSGTNQAG